MRPPPPHRHPATRPRTPAPPRQPLAEATQPEDWDEEEDGTWEPPKVANPKCADAAGCGAWVRPKKANPEYKGKWTAPMIDNPAYKARTGARGLAMGVGSAAARGRPGAAAVVTPPLHGTHPPTAHRPAPSQGPWAPRKIANPHHYTDETPLANVAPIGAAAIEIWTMDKGYTFSNVLLATDPADAAAARDATWAPKHAAEKEEAAKEEAAAKASAEAGPTLAARIAALFEEGAPLAKLRGPAEPLLDALEDKPALAWALVAAPALLAALPLALVLRGAGAKAAPAKKDKAAAASKKKDVTGPNDAEPADEGEGEGEGEEEAEERAPRRRARRAD